MGEGEDEGGLMYGKDDIWEQYGGVLGHRRRGVVGVGFGFCRQPCLSGGREVLG